MRSETRQLECAAEDEVNIGTPCLVLVTDISTTSGWQKLVSLSSKKVGSWQLAVWQFEIRCAEFQSGLWPPRFICKDTRGGSPVGVCSKLEKAAAQSSNMEDAGEAVVCIQLINTFAGSKHVQRTLGRNRRAPETLTPQKPVVSGGVYTS